MQLLFVGFLTNLFWDELVEFFLNETCNSCLDRPVNLHLDLTGVTNQDCEHLGQTLLTFSCDVLQN